MLVKPRTEEQLILMRESGRITAKALKKVLESAKEGVTLNELDKVAEEAILAEGATPSFKTVKDYFWTTCLTVNDEVVHGIPRDIVLKKGDKISIDLGAVYKGWHTDVSWSIMVGGAQSKFLDIGQKALWAAVKQARKGNRIGDIASTIQGIVEGQGYSVVRSLVGHGVGEELHMEPEVPGFGKPGTGMVLQKGMTLAIEVIYTEGKPGVSVADDDWTIVSSDGSLGGLFEMTVVIGDKGGDVLTDWRTV